MIDHLVLPVTTLTLARSRLTGLGFTVAPDARHPFGTGNCCVLFENRSYLEPITIVDRNMADQAAADGLFFVKRLRRFMERRGEGLAMLALRSGDADADQARLDSAGIGAGPVFRFSRPATQTDGTEREIGVALACADHADAPEATLFACQHLAADVLFQPDWLRHPNGAAGIARIAAVTESPIDFSGFLTSVTGLPSNEVDGGIEFDRDGQSVTILKPAAFRDRYGVAAPDPRRGLVFAALEIAVADLEKTVGFAGPTAIRHSELIVTPPAPGLGAVLAFRDGADA